MKLLISFATDFFKNLLKLFTCKKIFVLSPLFIGFYISVYLTTNSTFSPKLQVLVITSSKVQLDFKTSLTKQFQNHTKNCFVSFENFSLMKALRSDHYLFSPHRSNTLSQEDIWQESKKSWLTCRVIALTNRQILTA